MLRLGNEVTMSSALTIATGGMNAAADRLDVAASRIARLSTGLTADQGGTILPPAASVDLSASVLDLVKAQTDFALNAKVAHTADRMMKSTLDILV